MVSDLVSNLTNTALKESIKTFVLSTGIRFLLVIYNSINDRKKAIEEIVLNVDILSTILGFTNVAIPTDYQGKILKVIYIL